MITFFYLNISIVENLACDIPEDSEANSGQIKPLVVVVLILLILSIQSPQKSPEIKIN